MKCLFLFLLLTPFFCFSQEDRTRVPAAKTSSATDCPTWKNKGKSKAASKADYFQYLRTAKPPQNVPTAPTKSISQVQMNNAVSQRTITSNPEKEKDVIAPIPSTSITKITKNETPVVSATTTSTTVSKPEAPIVTFSATSVNTEGTRATEPQADEKSKASDKLEDEKTKLKRKLALRTRKTTKVRKHSNSKCPAF